MTRLLRVVGMLAMVVGGALMTPGLILGLIGFGVRGLAPRRAPGALPADADAAGGVTVPVAPFEPLAAPQRVPAAVVADPVPPEVRRAAQGLTALTQHRLCQAIFVDGRPRPVPVS